MISVINEHMHRFEHLSLRIVDELGHNHLLNKIARLYFEQDLTQNEIASQLRLSRQKIQRLLREAKAEGVVQITIRPIMGTFTELENRLEQRFGLREALVIETSDFDDQQVVTREVGAAAAEYSSDPPVPGCDCYFLGWHLIGDGQRTLSQSCSTCLP
jgi:predicted DNA-binding protein YlxM (UPF0122 family)